MAHRSFNSARRSAYTLNARIRTNEGHTATRRAQAQHNKGEAFTASADDGYLPLNRPHLTSLFGAVLAHADYFDSKFHDRNLPSSTSTDSRSLVLLTRALRFTLKPARSIASWQRRRLKLALALLSPVVTNRREEQGYQKRPAFCPIDTSRLWEEYQAQRYLHRTLRQAKLASLAVSRAVPTLREAVMACLSGGESRRWM